MKLGLVFYWYPFYKKVGVGLHWVYSSFYKVFISETKTELISSEFYGF
jgi:hypothetical protein